MKRKHLYFWVFFGLALVILLAVLGTHSTLFTSKGFHVNVENGGEAIQAPVDIILVSGNETQLLVSQDSLPREGFSAVTPRTLPGQCFLTLCLSGKPVASAGNFPPETDTARIRVRVQDYDKAAGELDLEFLILQSGQAKFTSRQTVSIP